MSGLVAILFIFAVVVLVLGLVLHLWTRTITRAAENAVPRLGQMHPVTGGAIHFVETGRDKAETVVLIHGLAAQLQHFTYALADLLRDDFNVVIVDRPGCGYSLRDGAEQATLTEQARMLGEFLDARGVANPVLVGHSLGGALALTMALERPRQVGALALLAPLTQVQDTIPPIFRPLIVRGAALRALIANTLSGPMGKLTGDKLLAEAFAPEPVPGDFMLRAAAVLGLRPKGFMSSSEDLVALENAMPAQVARYPSLSVRGGILYGADDALLPADVHGSPMQAFGLSCALLPGRGHMLPITAPQDCADFVRRMAALAP